MSGTEVAEYLYTFIHAHVGKENILYRIFYYDCMPMAKKVHNPITKRCVDFSKTDEYRFRCELFEALKKKRKVALRLGILKENGKWNIRHEKIDALMKGEITVNELTEDDVYYEIRQKGIDMKIGVDISSMALKNFVDRIVLVSGDADFVPAAKLARREGVDFILDPMGANVEQSLFEHIDGMEKVKIRIKKRK